MENPEGSDMQFVLCAPACSVMITAHLSQVPQKVFGWLEM